jgi:phenylpyruvate tautomerase PptA (4-oxalocrotonate tautomerase family)
VPHLAVQALESDLAGREAELIAGLTEAVAEVYGEWVRGSVEVLLVGVPAGRWGIGGRAAAAPAPRVTFGIRATVLDRPDASDVLGRLATGITDAVAHAMGEHVRAATTIEFVGRPEGHTGVGGTLSAVS